MMEKKTQNALVNNQVYRDPPKKRLTFEKVLRRTQHKHAIIIRALESN